ncbi:MAG TPA: hypothetical protein VN922_09830, partial [Bacteroidia bacterium]|nr:hypothetical protein [Bacteroidia bacterium]
LIAFMSVLKKRNLVFPLSLLAICIIFSVIEITAPGNGKRATNFFPHGHQLLFSIKESIISSKNFLLHWLPFMLLIGLLLFDLLSQKNIWNNDNDIIFSIPPWFSLIACLLIPVIGMFLLFWAEGQFPPLRSVNVIFFYFITAMLYFFLSLISYIKKRFPDFTLPAYIKLPAYFMLVFVLAFRTNNISVAYKDITSGIASEYNREQTERFEFLTNFKGDSCTIDSIRHVPYSFSFFELPQDFRCKKTEGDENNITTDAQYFYRMRTSFYRYYHKRYIGIKGRKN